MLFQAASAISRVVTSYVTLNQTYPPVSAPASQVYKNQIAQETKAREKIRDLTQQHDNARKLLEFYTSCPGNETMFAYMLRYHAVDKADDISKKLSKLGIAINSLESEYIESNMRDKSELKGQLATFAFSFKIFGHFFTWYIDNFMHPLSPSKNPRQVA